MTGHFGIWWPLEEEAAAVDAIFFFTREETEQMGWKRSPRERWRREKRPRSWRKEKGPRTRGKMAVRPASAGEGRRGRPRPRPRVPAEAARLQREPRRTARSRPRLQRKPRRTCRGEEERREESLESSSKVQKRFGAFIRKRNGPSTFY